MAHAPLLGGRNNPISRSAFNDVVLQHLVHLDASGQLVTNVNVEHGVRWYAKVAPTLVLFPNPDEMTAGGDPGMRGADGSETPADVRTLLRTKSGRTFQEAFMHIHGKALLLNFCSPSIEVYPKDKVDCKKIYDLDSVNADHVPDAALASDDALQAYLGGQLQRMQTGPLRVSQFDYALIRRAMTNDRNVLRREEPWRMAWNRKGSVLARKLNQEDIGGLLRLLGSDLLPDGRLYREESYDPKYEFGMGDYVIIDVELTERGPALKYDKNGEVLVRTVNMDAFEHTYALDAKYRQMDQ